MAQHLICCIISAVAGFGLCSVLVRDMSGGWTILFILAGVAFTVLTQEVNSQIKRGAKR